MKRQNIYGFYTLHVLNKDRYVLPRFSKQTDIFVLFTIGWSSTKNIIHPVGMTMITPVMFSGCIIITWRRRRTVHWDCGHYLHRPPAKWASTSAPVLPIAQQKRSYGFSHYMRVHHVVRIPWLVLFSQWSYPSDIGCWRFLKGFYYSGCCLWILWGTYLYLF